MSIILRLVSQSSLKDMTESANFLLCSAKLINQQCLAKLIRGKVPRVGLTDLVIKLIIRS